MKLQHSVASLSLLAMSVLAYSSENTSDVQMVHLAFHGGPASYRMAMPANGHIFKTGSFLRRRPGLQSCVTNR